MNTLRSSLRAAAGRLVAQDLDRHPERAQVRGEGLRPGPGRERRRAQPVARDHAHESDVGELRAGRSDQVGHRALERGARRVEVGVDLAFPQRVRTIARGGERGGRRGHAQDQVAAVDGRARVGGALHAGDVVPAGRIEAADRDAGGHELSGEDAPGLAEAEQGDGERRHLREAYLSARSPDRAEVFAHSPGVWRPAGHSHRRFTCCAGFGSSSSSSRSPGR